MVSSLLLAFVLAAGTPQATDDVTRFDHQVAQDRELKARVVRHWANRAPVGPPQRDFPNRFSVAPQYEGSVSREERLLMGRRLNAIADLVLAQPTLQSPDIMASFEPPILHRLHMNDGDYLSMGVTFRLQQGGDFATITVDLTLDRDRSDELRVVGESVGGCRLEQDVKGAGAGGISYRYGAEGPTSGTTIRGFNISPGAYINPRRPFEAQADFMAGRVIAAVETMDCARLLELANLP